MLPTDWSLLPLAKRQRGVVSYEQAYAVGFTRSAIRFRLESGEWVPMLPRVARMYWSTDDWATRCRAALLWARDSRAALSHVTAAQLLGFDVESAERIHLVARFRFSDVRWLCVHRRRRSETVRVDCHRVTSVSQTLLDLASMLDAAELERVVRVAARSGLLSTSSLRDVVARATRRAGAGSLRSALTSLCG